MKLYRKIFLAAEVVFVALLLASRFPSHMVFQERYQLFLWTWRYFVEVVSVPGGMADWTGRFFTQFFFNPWVGAGIVSALLIVFQLLLLSFVDKKPLWLSSLTALPVAILFAFYTNENAMLSAVVALILSLAAARGVASIGRSSVRMVVTLVATPILYMVSGPLCLMFLAALSTRDWKAALSGLPLSVLTVFASSWVFQYPMKSLAGGVHYYRFLQTVRPEPWYALAFAAVVLLLQRFFRGEGKAPVNAAVMTASVVSSLLIVAWPLLERNINRQKEETIRYTLLAENEDWDGIIEAAGRGTPSLSPVSVACLNLAMAKTGMFPDGLFKGFQNGPQGLISDKKIDFISPLAFAHVYWALGLVDSAQRMVYEAQESIPDYQKSAYCHKWLARTNRVNGDHAVADKYMEALGHTLFYRKWRPSDDVGHISKQRLTEKDMVSSDENIHEVLSLLARRDTSNTLARDYLLAYDMLALDLDGFVADYQATHRSQEVVSVVYAEALALAWARNHRDFNGIPWTLPEGIAERCVAFFGDRGANRPKGTMRSKYGTTYWFYYFYHGK
ncbi:MAG: hypothetical protein IJ840_03170 [Bacteroidales bacterium]|nr:hypothetical protein [Bacteroidales bacterium]